jgi:hypothetical protein
MSWHRAAGISACCAAGANAGATRCASPTGFSAAIHSVKHIVGLCPEGDYLPMLWDTFRHSSPRTHWIDFKYQRGRSPWGLNKRVVLEKPQLARLLRSYEQVTGLAIIASRGI